MTVAPLPPPSRKQAAAEVLAAKRRLGLRWGQQTMSDGIVSAIDLEFDIERLPDPKGDRVRITLNGKFLPYRVW